jgi:hypothetical protein
MVKKHNKVFVALQLDVTDTRTIDRWIDREMIPSKYLDRIKEMK